MFVKTQIHLHNNQDPLDNFLDYGPYEAIDCAFDLGFKIISFTNHRSFCFDQDIRDYAFSKGIILIPGIELELRRKHVLVYGCAGDICQIKTFKDFREYKKDKNLLVIAPHPFYKAFFCLGKSLQKNLDLFDAVEYGFFYTKSFFGGPNKKAQSFCIKNNLPLIGNGDIHQLKDFEKTYSMIKIDFDINNLSIENYDYYIQNIFDNIKKNNIKIISKAMTFSEVIKMNLFFLYGYITRPFQKYIKKI